MAARKSMGRKRIDIIKIQDETNRLVTFSKRRSGLFNKASKLSTISGAEIALILFSPAGRVHTFGHSSLDSVINEFLGENDGDNILKAYREIKACELNKQFVTYQTLLEDEKKSTEMLATVGKENESEHWWMAASIEELDMKQLEDLKKKIEALKGDIINHVHKGVIGDQAASSSSFAAENISSPVVLDLTLGPSRLHEDPYKPEGSKAREFHRFV